ncbi:aldehyde dehydrogenase [Mycobacterium aquaticum]|uniref:Aldehyde dehydrogenase n=1 Tax=Mycobacterium aquaticum TaxID=1927124 RepID=A0A1X0A8E2_9MYCO|nr:aldehyde dehydrogenase [Mycobacterium aquaticum]ORA26274.1 aldehyde dehydrogenase [Mycobacterium aquaticum]
MTSRTTADSPLLHPRELFVDGQWVAPSRDDVIEVIDSNDESIYLTVAAAGKDDVARAVTAARTAFDEGPWPRMTHARRAEYVRRLADGLRSRAALLADAWPRESGALYSVAQGTGEFYAGVLDFYADVASDFAWEEQAPTTPGAGFSMIVREPVGVVGAIVPWNSPLGLAIHKIAPALLSGCTIVLKAAPEAPTMVYILAECAEDIGLPAGVLNVVTADREASESLVTDPRVDKIAFTGSTVAGRRIASLMGQRIGRVTLELGGKSPAVILDDADLGQAASAIAQAECHLTGQSCASLTRLIVTRARHDHFVEALSAAFSAKKVGNAFDPASQMGPLVSARQRDRVLGYINQGVDSGARLVVGGGRPAALDRGYFIEPTVLAEVDNSSVVAQDEIFGPVLTVLPARDEADAIRIANDTIYGLNASVFTPDVDRARHVARQLRSGTVGHNDFRLDARIAFGGFKQSGLGREGGREGFRPYLETKVVILDAPPEGYR